MSIQLELWGNSQEMQAQPQGAPACSVVASQPQADASVEPLATPPKPDTLSTLRKQIRKVETSRRPKLQAISAGAEALDDLLPQNGYPPGSLVEWIGAGEGSGAAWLSLLAARSAHESSGGKVVVLDSEQTFYPPAAVACGLPADAIILLRPKSREDAIWALDQSLRSGAVAAVCGMLPRLDDTDARRLQLAAETGGTLGMILRPARAINEPSWAEVRWHVRGMPTPKQSRVSHPSSAARVRKIAVRLLRVRGAAAGKELLLSIDQTSGMIRRELPSDTTSTERLAAELAHPTVARQQVSRRA